MLKIGDFSKLSRISIRMLRHYNDIGLLIPESIDAFTGYRFYNEAQLMEANRITALKEMGFSLSAIREILKNYAEPQLLKKYLELKMYEVQEQADKTTRQLRLIETTIKRLGEDEQIMKYNVTLKELPQRTVASVKKVLPGYDQEGVLWGIMMREIEPLNVKAADPCYALAIFHDGEYKEHDVEVEVQRSVEGNYPDTENVVFKTVPPILMASATCKGSYEQMNAVNESVATWVRDNGYEFDGLSFCIYHVSPYETQNPDEYVTEVCYPVKKK